MSGIWDTGLRYQSYEDCISLGVRASYLASQEHGKNFYDIDPETREDYHNVFKCIPSK